MKNLLICFFFTPLLSFTQNKISGLGPFKIGKTSLLDLDKLMEDQHQPLSGELQEDSTYIYKGDIFDLGALTVRNLSLSFYRDTLYAIQCDCDSKLNEAIELKYGKPQIASERKTIHCRSGLKINYTETESFTTYIFTNTVGYVKASRSEGVYFDYECKKRFFDQLRIINPKVSSASYAAYERRKDKRERSRRDSLKKQLDGL